MDFWAKLIAGTAPSPSSTTKAQAYDPEKRRLNFIREYDHLLQIWRATSNISKTPDTTKAVRASIQNLAMILSDETRRPTPHVCITHAASRQVYVLVSKIAIMSHNEAVVREAVGFFTTLVESEEEGFLKDADFAEALMNLLFRATGVLSMGTGPDTEVEILELAFGIAAKLRLRSEILPAWFEAHETKAGPSDSMSAQERFAGKTQKEDFPLFYLLIDFIHHDGRTGDFARTGLLYIIEAASHSLVLEQWLIESDLATLMSTGLGALYSQLSRKLVVDYDPNDLPLTLLLSDYSRPDSKAEVISSASEKFKAQMDTFLSHLMFWQDVLEHCRSAEVKQTLLDHFHIIFLQQLLYPSLLESSDVDGGSAVAVLTYLRRILETVTHFDMTHLILHYLLALPDVPIETSTSPPSMIDARKRKSLDLVTMVAAQDTTPALFSLVDLLTSSLRSRSHQTVTSALQLLSILLKRHHQHTSSTLMKTSRNQRNAMQRSIGQHEKELGIILNLVGDLGPNHDFDDDYRNHVTDATTLLESHVCSQRLLFPHEGDRSFGIDNSIIDTFEEAKVQTIRYDDPILTNLIRVLELFFINPIEVNLCVTEVIIDLVSCGLTDVLGWLLPDPAKHSTAMKTTEGRSTTSAKEQNAMSAEPKDPQQTPSMPKLVDEPPAQVLRLLHGLAKQVNQYQSQIVGFDSLLCYRRRQLQREVDSASNMRSTHDQRKGSSAETHVPRVVTHSPSRLSAFDLFAQRVLQDFTSTSRSNSPKGSSRTRQSQESQLESSIRPTAAKGRASPFTRVQSQDTDDGPPKTLIDGAVSLKLSEKVTKGDRLTHSGVDANTILQQKIGMHSMTSLLNMSSIPNAERYSSDGSNMDVIQRQVMSKGDQSVAGLAVSLGVHEFGDGPKVTVSHVLTNVVVFQEFLLELAALLQVRASMFGEVCFT